MKDANQLAAQWASDERWKGIERSYSAEDVVRLRGSVVEQHTLPAVGPRSCGAHYTARLIEVTT